MRVVHVITRLIIGGAQENTIATVLGLREKRQVSVKLVSGPTLGPEGSLEPRVSAVPDLLEIVPNLVRSIHPLRDILALTHLRRIFSAYQPDIVHTHSGKAGVLGRVAAHRAGVPTVVHTIHGPSFGHFQGPMANFPLLQAERYAGRMTTHFVAVSDAMSKQYLTAGIGSPSQYTRIFSGFSLQPFLSAQNDLGFREKLGLGADDFVVGKIARLVPLKGHEDLIAAASLLTRTNATIRFLLIGDGLLREELQTRVRAAGLDKHFVFLGLVPPEDIPRYLGIMDALVHLSLREGLARALPQALAARRPVVAYDCDGAREVCLHGQTGFLVQPGAIEELKERIVQLAENSQLRQRLGEAGCELVKQHFPTEKMLDAIYELYLGLR